MQHWNTQKILEILKASAPEFQYEVGEFGGDYDTNPIHVKDGEEYLCDVQGWHLDGVSQHKDWDDVDVEYIAVNVGRYGLEGAEPEDLIAVAKVTKALTAAGYEVTNSGWKSWF